MMPYASTTTSMVVPYSGAMTGMTAMTMSPVCSANVSTDTACLLNQISALRNDIRSLQGTVRAAALSAQGQQLVSRMNMLIADELMFRQEIAQNPTMPNAHAQALALTAQADALNRDIADYNRQLSLIPADQRPYIASDLNTFTVAYWQPAMTRFAEFRTNFANSSTAYQPAYAANPWLQPWQTTFSSDIGNIAMDQQQYASVNWWSSMQVAGSTEVFPGGTLTTPSGAVIYIPAGAILMPVTTTTGTTTTTTPTTTTTTTGGTGGTY